MAGEADVGAVADEDARAQELLAQGRRLGDLHQQEVRLGRRERVAPPAEPLRQEPALLDDEAARALPVRLVLERGERRDLAEAVHVVGLADAVQPVQRLGAGDRVAHAEPGERRDLREGAEQDQPRVAPQQRDAVRVLGVVDEVTVRLIEDHERRVVAERLEERAQRLLAHDRRRRVVGRAEHDRRRPVGDLPPHVLEVGRVAGEWARHGAGARDRGRDAVGLERRLGHDDLVAGLERGPRDEPDQLVGAVADEELAGRDVEAPGERRAERGGAAVGIEVDARGLARDRLDDARRGAERVLVGGEARELRDPELRGELLEGLARVVGDEGAETLAPDLPHGLILVTPRAI